MSAMRIFAASTGLHPFSINRVSFTLAFTIATLVITKLINGYLFCGFNANIYVELPYGIILFAGYCIMPLLGLTVNRRPKTKGGCCCRMFAITLIDAWLLGITCIGTFYFFYLVGLAGGIEHDDKFFFAYSGPNLAAWDPFSICGNRTVENVRAHFSKAMPTYDVLQRIDLVYKIVNGVAWLLPMAFAATAFGFFMESLQDRDQEHQPLEDSEAGSPDEQNDEAIIWIEEDGEASLEEFSNAVKLETTDEVSDQPATIGIECEEQIKSSDNGDHDAEQQFLDAEAEISCIDEEKEDSKKAVE